MIKSYSLAAVFTTAVAVVLAAVPRMTNASYGIGLIDSYLSNSKICCTALSQFLPENVASSSDSSYNESLSSYWSLQEAEIQPTCIIRPETSSQVSTAVSLLAKFERWLPGGCKYAVRGAGHTPHAGAANIQNGITIDLALLNQVTVSDDQSSVVIGPGNSWGQVFDSLPNGLLTLGGRWATVGVGGLVLGGGISFFSPRYGFVCDNVIRFEVVLASGEIVNATKDSYQDLWLALKGGSNNFGIVTAIEQHTFEQGDFWGGIILNDQSTFEDQFKAFEAFTGNPDFDPYSALIMNIAYIGPAAMWIASNSLEYTKPEANPPIFRNFTTLPSMSSTMRIGNVSDFAKEIAASSPLGFRQQFMTGTYRNSAEMVSRIFSYSNETVQTLRDVAGLTFALSFQPISTVLLQASAAAGENSLGLDPSQGPLFNFLLTVSWQSASDDELVYEQTRKLYQRSEAAAGELGVQNTHIYLNYAAPWQDPIAGYGEEVKLRLQEVSKRYDPRGMFQSQVPGGFKLFK